MPETIAVSIAAVLDKSNFTAFYCACGAVCLHEYELMAHAKQQHYAVYRLLSHMKYTHLPISSLQLADWVNHKKRSDLLGTVNEQQHRIVRIIYLVIEMPHPPGCVKFQVAQHYSYEELVRFEKGEQDLYVKSSVTRGRGARGGSSNWSLR